jgi:uncharacterized protein
MMSAEHEGIAGVTFGSDGHRLAGILYLARGAAAKPTALLLHGCPGLEQNFDLASSLRERGWNALVFHYRGSWGSAGEYDLRTVVQDVRAAVDHLQEAAYQGVDPARLAVFGHSLGGWAAIQAAAADCRLKGAVACASVTGLGGLTLLPADVIEREFTRFLRTTPAEFVRQAEQVDTRPGPLDVVATIAPRPLLVVHGSDDEWVPAAQGRQLFERAGEPRRHIEMAGANHAFSWHRPQLRDLVGDWLAETGI